MNAAQPLEGQTAVVTGASSGDWPCHRRAIGRVRCARLPLRKDGYFDGRVKEEDRRGGRKSKCNLRSELEEDSIRVTNVLPGATVTNFARNFGSEFTSGILKMAGSDIELQKGERLPDEVLQKVSSLLKERFADPIHVAKAVLYAVTQPIEINIADIVVRPPKR